MIKTGNRVFMNRVFVISVITVILAFLGCQKKEIQGGDRGVIDMEIKKDAVVSINYTLTVDDTVIDSSLGKDSLSYVQGAGQIIPGLEEQLAGLNIGDKKKVVVSPDKGYGERDPNAARKVSKKLFQNPEGLKVGSAVSGQDGDKTFRATIVDITDQDVTLDLNHPLAGKTLNFDIEVVDIQMPKE